MVTMGRALIARVALLAMAVLLVASARVQAQCSPGLYMNATLGVCIPCTTTAQCAAMFGVGATAPLCDGTGQADVECESPAVAATGCDEGLTVAYYSTTPPISVVNPEREFVNASVILPSTCSFGNASVAILNWLSPNILISRKPAGSARMLPNGAVAYDVSFFIDTPGAFFSGVELTYLVPGMSGVNEETVTLLAPVALRAPAADVENATVPQIYEDVGMCSVEYLPDGGLVSTLDSAVYAKDGTRDASGASADAFSLGWGVNRDTGVVDVVLGVQSALVEAVTIVVREVDSPDAPALVAFDMTRDGIVYAGTAAGDSVTYPEGVDNRCVLVSADEGPSFSYGSRIVIQAAADAASAGTNQLAVGETYDIEVDVLYADENGTLVEDTFTGLLDLDLVRAGPANANDVMVVLDDFEAVSEWLHILNGTVDYVTALGEDFFDFENSFSTAVLLSLHVETMDGEHLTMPGSMDDISLYAALVFDDEILNFYVSEVDDTYLIGQFEIVFSVLDLYRIVGDLNGRNGTFQVGVLTPTGSTPSVVVPISISFPADAEGDLDDIAASFFDDDDDSVTPLPGDLRVVLVDADFAGIQFANESDRTYYNRLYFQSHSNVTDDHVLDLARELRAIVSSGVDVDSLTTGLSVSLKLCQDVTDWFSPLLFPCQKSVFTVCPFSRQRRAALRPLSDGIIWSTILKPFPIRGVQLFLVLSIELL